MESSSWNPFYCSLDYWITFAWILVFKEKVGKVVLRRHALKVQDDLPRAKTLMLLLGVRKYSQKSLFSNYQCFSEPLL